MPKRLTPAERVERLRKRYGSHDKVALALSTRALELGLSKRPTRQSIIRWESGARISEAYAHLLASLADEKPESFRPALSQPASPGRQLAELAAAISRVEGRVSRIEKAVDLPPGEAGPRVHEDDG